jgi:hypothetical protein
MKLEVLDVERFVAANGLQRVSDLVFLEADGSATRGGLFSAEIFGRPGSEDRRTRWAYIDLGGEFLHPLIYKACCQLDRGFPDAITGARRFRLNPAVRGLDWVGDDDAGGGPPALSGVAGLREIWDRLDWGPSAGGGARAQRAGLLRAVPARLAFVGKWPVMPAAYRDVDTGVGRGGRIREIAPVNYLYSTVMASAPSSQSGFQFADGSRKLRAQEALLEVHQSCLALVSKKHGIIQDRILGKYADYAVQGVISGPALAKADRPGEQEVPFGSLGVPLYLAINLFQPFVMKSLEERFRALAGGQEGILQNPPGWDRLTPAERAAAPLSALEQVALPPDARAQLNPDTYKRWIGRFMRSQEDRATPLYVETGRGARVEVPLYDWALGRKTTLADLFYIVASVVCANRHVMFSRYPIEDFRSCQFARVALLTTERTERRAVGGTEYPRYPLLGPGARWVDSIRLNNSYTEALGADFDGDRVRIFGLFTQEANAQAEDLIRRPTNFVDGQGRPSRNLKNEGILTLYSLTA